MGTANRTLKIRIDNGPEIDGVLNIDVEQIDVTVMTKTTPDLTWELVDDQGHFHAWDSEGNLPTLEARSEHVECGCSGDEDDCDGYDITIRFCAICEQVIEPAVIVTHPLGREYAQGRKTWEVIAYADLEQGQKVSVRVHSGGSADEQQAQAFGIGVAVKVDYIQADNGVRRLAKIAGVGPLGYRKTAVRV